MYRAEYSFSSNLYTNILLKLGMVSKVHRQDGAEREIVYAIAKCDLGYLFVATTAKGICTVKLGDRPTDLIETFKAEFSNAEITRNNRHKDWIEQILMAIDGKTAGIDLPLDIQGTAFQRQVWQTLQKIPYGETKTYKEIAERLNKSKATRAIGNACGANPVALIIPCHRVLRSDGSLGGYRWGIERKQRLLEIEQQNK